MAPVDRPSIRKPSDPSEGGDGFAYPKHKPEKLRFCRGYPNALGRRRDAAEPDQSRAPGQNLRKHHDGRKLSPSLAGRLATLDLAATGKSRFSGQTVSQIKELQRELRLLGARNVVISSNVPVRQDGLPYADAAKRRYDDPGVAIYFTLKQKPLAMARDRYWTPWENMRSLVLAIESIRSIERHGGQTMMERAFSGFTALPAPNRAGKFLALSLGPVCKQSNRSSALRPRSRTRTLEVLTLQWPSLSSHTTKLSRRPSYEHR